MDQKLIILISDNSKNREFRTSLSWNFINSTKIPWNMTKKIFAAYVAKLYFMQIS
jgi:hypothetical protein